MDLSLLLFRRQYMQLFDPDFLAWPHDALLRLTDVQAWLYENLFDVDKTTYLPPERYQLRVLKRLVSRIEKAIEDPQEDELFDDLMARLSTLMSAGLPDEGTAVQQKAYVTFSCAQPEIEYSRSTEPAVTLLERRHLISGSRTTGFRTWEAALHLGTYLLTPAGSALVRGKSLIELGAGTGFLSILCQKHLQTRHITVTDGDEGVVDALRENLFLNGLDDNQKVNASILRWGSGLVGTWVEEDCDAWPYDVVLGADITYDKVAISALVATFRLLFAQRPALHIIIAGAVRNRETFETFLDACRRSKFSLTEIDFPPKPMLEQKVLFYATTMPLKIFSITCPLPEA